MKKLVFSLLLLCLFCTCKKDNQGNLCGGSDPIKNLPWLKVKIDTLQKYSSSNPIIKRFSYQNTTYFREGSTCTNCNYTPLFFDCEGNKLQLRQEQIENLQSKASSNTETIWKTN